MTNQDAVAGKAMPPGSPCTKVCRLNDQGVCIGCGRTLEQIKEAGKHNG